MKKLFVLLVVLLLSCSKEQNQDSFNLTCDKGTIKLECNIISNYDQTVTFNIQAFGNMQTVKKSVNIGQNNFTIKLYYADCPDDLRLVNVKYEF